MKTIIIDILLVFIIMCFVGLYFDEYEVSKIMFDNSIEQFENNLNEGETIDQQQIVYNHCDNTFSLLCNSISQICISFIQFFTVFFSNFISMILFIMLY